MQETGNEFSIEVPPFSRTKYRGATRQERHRLRLIAHLIVLALLLHAITLAQQSDWNTLISRLDSDGKAGPAVVALFSDPSVKFDPEPTKHKLRSLFESRFKADRLKRIQDGLTALGYDAGESDGLNGPRTQSAIAKFQRDHGFPRDARISEALVERIETVRFPDRVKDEKKTGPPVYQSVLKADRLSEAQTFIEGHDELLSNVEKTYGIPQEIAVAILTVETRAGNYLGAKLALNTLASMSLCNSLDCTASFFDDHVMTPERKRWLGSQSRKTSGWAYAELKALLTYSENNRLDPLTMPGSIYGAIGVSQFMPSSALKLGVDGDGDGIVDLFNVPDAVHSMANYLKKNGWRAGLSTRRRRTVIYRYNRSRTYVNTVLAVAERLDESSGNQ